MSALLLGAAVLTAAYVAMLLLILRPWAQRAYERAAAETAAGTFEAHFIAENADVAAQDRPRVEAELLAHLDAVETHLREAGLLR